MNARYADKSMLSWFRERSRSIACAALLALLTLTISSAAPHPDDCHDADCGLALPHDPSGHSIDKPQESSGQPIHCVLCHWTRSVRPTPETAPFFAPALAENVKGVIDVFITPSQIFLAQPALRGPPATSVLA
jgi:hypothetical protein